MDPWGSNAKTKDGDARQGEGEEEVDTIASRSINAATFQNC